MRQEELDAIRKRDATFTQNAALLSDPLKDRRALLSEVERLRKFLGKIDEYAAGGQEGTAAYARDRLSQIRAIALLGIGDAQP